MTSHQEAPAAVSPALYQEIQQFYASHVRTVDEGRPDAWAADFTEDAVFGTNGRPEPLVGRETIRRNAQEAAQRLRTEGIARRHWLGMLEAYQQPDGSVLARTYTQIIRTPPGGPSQLELACLCEDVLVREGGRLLVHRRQVNRDDLPS
ncbi:nuclear transport factor 2 family protein [Crossiella sp. SN42]|uniref:nuclear transport factor 2 family protein n=1 Tax=Crossiella sp. SN42 TaxID=2944808 RepID=UPI00207C448A|nr:nuclear transport factor 2 family protein [Crossiella sp. SN42]MCO1575090.1 nuclear transport factor 2 family protein [Crossiella sp. SN42]